MRVEFVPPDSVTEPRHGIPPDHAFAMVPAQLSGVPSVPLWCERHVGEWVGLMNVPQLQLGISDAALMASSDGAYDEVELRASHRFAKLRLRALAAAAHAKMVAGFPSARNG